MKKPISEFGQVRREFTTAGRHDCRRSFIRSKRLAARRRNAESSPRCRPPRIDRDRYDEIYQLRSRAERGGRCGADRGAGVGPCRDRVASSIHGPETRRVVTNEVDARIYVPMHDLHVLPARI